jgi:hypothetical protein
MHRPSPPTPDSVTYRLPSGAKFRPLGLSSPSATTDTDATSDAVVAGTTARQQVRAIKLRVDL